MADLIERYKITANLPSVLMNYCNKFNSKQLESITEMIYELENSIESADVQPVRHGRWILRSRQISDVTVKLPTECSNCDFSEYNAERHNFCPNCGARMKED